MKKNIQAEILKSLNNTNIFLENIFKSNSFSKKKLKDGLFEWSNEDEQFFRINPEKKIYFKNLLFLENHYDILIKNTKQFLNGNSANSVLLWGSRGTGKSSLVMSLYYSLKEKFSFSMIEIKFFQINSLPKILRILEKEKQKIIIFCDDFSFQLKDEKFILFKNILEGSLRKNPNIIFYVTSNFRHLVRDKLKNNNLKSEIKDVNENIVSLSDRFGIWIGFHNFSLDQYIKIIFHYSDFYKLKISKGTIKKKAIEWSIVRGSNSGREALNFVRYMMLEE